MAASVNPAEKPVEQDAHAKQTFEMRCPDCSADIYQLMAGLCVAARKGLEMDPKEALAIAEAKYVDMDIHKPENAERLRSLDALPTCCAESADCLEAVREVYEAEGVFQPRMIDGVIKALRAHNDSGLHLEASRDKALMKHLVKKFFYCG